MEVVPSLPELYFVPKVFPKNEDHMGAELWLECSRDLLLSHSEGSRSYLHHYSLLKLLTTKNLFLRFPNIHRGSEPGTRKADSVVVTPTKSPAESLSFTFSFLTYKTCLF